MQKYGVRLLASLVCVSAGEPASAARALSHPEDDAMLVAVSAHILVDLVLGGSAHNKLAGGGEWARMIGKGLSRSARRVKT